MLKFMAANVVVSKGPKDKPALRFSEGDTSVMFRIGKRVYDTRAEDNQRWVNVNAKAFGDLVKRIRKMKLDAGSFINIDGRYDEDVWQDKDGNTQRAPVVILTDIEYAYSGNAKSKQDGTPAASSEPPQNPSQPESQGGLGTDEMPDSFTGFSSFGGENPFFPQG